MGNIHFIPDRNRIDESVALAEKYNACFEYNDFSKPDVYTDEAKCDELVKFYKSLDRDRKKDTLHGAFLDVTVYSTDEQIRQISMLRVKKSLDIARELGIRGVVFHTNFIPNFRLGYYRDFWLEQNVDFFTKMCTEYSDLEIFIENMFDEDYDMILNLASQMNNVGNFGICLDYAHASSFGNNAKEWFINLFPYITHIHINDNDLYDDLHLQIGKGKIDWKEFFRIKSELKYDSSILIEVKEIEEQEASIKYLMDNGLI